MSELTGHNWRLLIGDVRERLADLDAESVHCCVTSPPYFGLRDYGVDGQIGLEASPEAFVETMVSVFREVRRVLRDDGTLWLNLGDSYCSNAAKSVGNGYDDGRANRGERLRNSNHGGLKPKDLMGMPWRVALALQADGWWLRSDIIWAKPNPMPSSVQDRPTTAHEYVFLLSKRPRYYYDGEAIREGVKPASIKRCAAGFTGNDPERDAHNTYGDGFQRGEGYELSGRNARSWWPISTQGFADAHFATFPEKLVARCIKAGTSAIGCCPECGAPWRRRIEKVRRPTRPGENTKVKVPGGWDLGEGGHGTIHREGRTEATYRDAAEVGNRDPERHVTESRTTGWGPSCEHEYAREDVAPIVVLDPFAGSGTTLKVARDLGRFGLGVELNAEYAAMAERRIRAIAKQTDPVENDPQRSLF